MKNFTSNYDLNMASIDIITLSFILFLPYLYCSDVLNE